MNTRTALNSLLPLAALAVASSLTFAQQPPAQPAPPDGSAPAAAPANPGPRPGRPGMMQGRPGMQNRAEIRNRFQGRGGPMEGGFGIGPEGMWWKNPRVVQALTLTPDQVKKMDGIFQTSRLQLIDLKANVQKQEVMLEPLLGANPLDTTKAQAQIDKVADARADLEKANAKMLLGIRAVLTADQWTKLHDHAFGRFGGLGGPGGPGAGGPGGPRGGQGGPAPAGGQMRGRGPGNGTVNNLVDPTPEP